MKTNVAIITHPKIQPIEMQRGAARMRCGWVNVERAGLRHNSVVMKRYEMFYR